MCTKQEKCKYRSTLPAILLMSHGPICTAVIESAAMLKGRMESVYALPFTDDMDIVEYTNAAQKLYDSLPDGSVILFDMFCGTPYSQMAIRYDGKEIYGVSGLSLPMFLDTLDFRQIMQGEELIQAVQVSARRGIVSTSVANDMLISDEPGHP